MDYSNDSTDISLNRISDLPDIMSSASNKSQSNNQILQIQSMSQQKDSISKIIRQFSMRDVEVEGTEPITLEQVVMRLRTLEIHSEFRFGQLEMITKDHTIKLAVLDNKLTVLENKFDAFYEEVNEKLNFLLQSMEKQKEINEKQQKEVNEKLNFLLQSMEKQNKKKDRKVKAVDGGKKKTEEKHEDKEKSDFKFPPCKNESKPKPEKVKKSLQQIYLPKINKK